MQKLIKNSLSPLLNPVLLNKTLTEIDFNNKFRILEANFGQSSLEDFNKGHIKHALYFDVMNGVEPSKYFPRDVPKEDLFKEYVSQLGISNKHHIIIYDRSQFGFFASSRAWWIFRLFGHENLSILDGGLNNWKNHNFDLTADNQTYEKENFKIYENKNLIRNYEDIIKNIQAQKEQVIDARPNEDFQKINPVLGVPNHIPNALNVPYSELFDKETGSIKDIKKLNELFKQKGVDLTKPLIASCNTSVTGSSLAFASYLLGAVIPVYRGSWTEYSQRKEEEESHRIIKN